MVERRTNGGDLMFKKAVADAGDVLHRRVECRKLRTIHIEVAMVKSIQDRPADNPLKGTGTQDRCSRPSPYANSDRQSIVVTMPAGVIAFPEGATVLIGGKFRAMQAVCGAKFKVLGDDGLLAHGSVPEKVDERTGGPSQGREADSLGKVQLQHLPQLANSIARFRGFFGVKKRFQERRKMGADDRIDFLNADQIASLGAWNASALHRHFMVCSESIGWWYSCETVPW